MSEPKTYTATIKYIGSGSGISPVFPHSRQGMIKIMGGVPHTLNIVDTSEFKAIPYDVARKQGLVNDDYHFIVNFKMPAGYYNRGYISLEDWVSTIFNNPPKDAAIQILTMSDGLKEKSLEVLKQKLLESGNIPDNNVIIQYYKRPLKEEVRSAVKLTLDSIPNIGKRMVTKLQKTGINTPEELIKTDDTVLNELGVPSEVKEEAKKLIGG
jgi:hypothetical protein